MKLGNSQNDIVSGEAKLSSILPRVSWVGRRHWARGWGGLSGTQRIPSLISQSPVSSCAVRASMREVNWVKSLKKNKVTLSSSRSDEASLPAWMMIWLPSSSLWRNHKPALDNDGSSDS